MTVASFVPSCLVDHGHIYAMFTWWSVLLLYGVCCQAKLVLCRGIKERWVWNNLMMDIFGADAGIVRDEACTWTRWMINVTILSVPTMSCSRFQWNWGAQGQTVSQLGAWVTGPIRIIYSPIIPQFCWASFSKWHSDECSTWLEC